MKPNRLGGGGVCSRAALNWKLSAGGAATGDSTAASGAERNGELTGDMLCNGATGERIGVGGFWTVNGDLNTVGERVRSEEMSSDDALRPLVPSAATDTSNCHQISMMLGK